jgi:hypothetical protein
MAKVVDFAAYRAVRRRRRSRLARLLASARAMCARAFAQGDRRNPPLWRVIQSRLRVRAARAAPPDRVVALRRPERR